jgi:hypothetical protein
MSSNIVFPLHPVFVQLCRYIDIHTSMSSSLVIIIIIIIIIIYLFHP